jgi:hypothetical protein
MVLKSWRDPRPTMQLRHRRRRRLIRAMRNRTPSRTRSSRRSVWLHGISEKYLAMEWYVRVIYSLWIVFTHVYTRFEIAPRLAMVSEGPESGKSVARKVASRLVYRPNEEALGTAAAIREYLDCGPGTVLLDELDYLDSDARRQLMKLWNLGHERGAKISLMVKGRRKLVDIHAPILGAGIGDIFERTQESRTFRLDMEPYIEQTKPERRYDGDDVADLDNVYMFLRNWARNVKLDSNPDTAGLTRRLADNARGDFEAVLRRHEAARRAGEPRLRLITSVSD